MMKQTYAELKLDGYPVLVECLDFLGTSIEHNRGTPSCRKYRKSWLRRQSMAASDYRLERRITIQKLVRVTDKQAHVLMSVGMMLLSFWCQ